MFFKPKNLVYIMLFFALVYSCARKGYPTGGPQDLTPPILMKAIPDTFAVNVPTNTKKIELSFDEYIVLKDFGQNFLISPPIEPSPIVSPLGTPSKHITINFNSELQSETTYSLNFGQSIADNNEGNKLPFFSYVFSTGDHIDSLTLAGKINFPLKKANEKIDNIIAALYKYDTAYTDSIIFKSKPFYVAKTDSALSFNFKNLKAGKYKLVAYNEEIPNLRFDPKTENFAFSSDIVDPTEPKEHNLTLYKPNLPYRFVEAKQVEQGKLAFYFEGKPEKVDVKLLSHKFTTEKIIHQPYSDTLTYYFNPTAKGDTLTDKRPRLNFMITHKGVSDSIPAIFYDNKKVTPLKVYARDINYVPKETYQIEANYPLDTLDKKFITIKEDTVNIDFKVKRLKYNRFGLEFPLKFNTKYKVSLLPGSAVDNMQRTNDSIQMNLSIKDEREYGNLILNIKDKPEFPAWLKLYNANNNEIKSIYSENDKFEIKYLVPGTYTVKLLIDENSNQRYDTGDFLSNKQPEKVFIYPTPIEIKAFWDVEETWLLNPENSSNDDSLIPHKNIPEEILNEKPKEEIK